MYSCKQFYLGTLNISQNVVYHVHDIKDTLIGTPKADARGKHPKKVVLPDMQNTIRDDIKDLSKPFSAIFPDLFHQLKKDIYRYSLI